MSTRPNNIRLEQKKNRDFFCARSIPEKCIDDCQYLVVIPDMYDTGDSPTGYDCEAQSRKDCPFWDNIS